MEKMIKKDRIEEKMKEYSEIQEAMAAMERIVAIENTKAREIFETKVSYFPLR